MAMMRSVNYDQIASIILIRIINHTGRKAATSDTIDSNITVRINAGKSAVKKTGPNGKWNGCRISTGIIT